MPATRLLIAAATAALIAGAAGTAQAQNYNGGYDNGYDGYHSRQYDGRYDQGQYQRDNAPVTGPEEEVTVTAPRWTYETEEGPMHPLGWPPQKVSISQRISAYDYDLATREGARRFRARVREAARAICHRLAEEYPYQAPQTPNCYSNIMNTAMVRADQAITRARQRGPSPSEVEFYRDRQNRGDGY